MSMSLLSRSGHRLGPALPVPGQVAARAVGATKVYGRGETAVVALDEVSIEFPVGTFTAVMGPSGSGKSTLLHCLAGLDSLSGGRVYIGGTDISALNDKALTNLRRDQVGFVFQAFNLVPTLDALENIVLPSSLAGRKPDKAWLDQVVAKVGLTNRLSHRPSELSGGQQQRVAVARALVSRPAIVFADEPTGNLDSRASAEVLSLLRGAVSDMAQTVVMVTHDPKAAEFASRTLHLEKGQLLEQAQAA